MADRKALLHYYPPDFDPSKIKRVKRPADRQQVVRLMAPYSMRCKSCGEFIPKGRKFNARKEDSQERYYKIKIFRFYIKCTRCSAEFTFKTDPKRADYEPEHGHTRNYEPWRENIIESEDPMERFAEEERLKELEASGQSGSARQMLEDESADPMALLEARQAEAKREMDVEDALQDLRTRNARIDRVDAGDVMERLAQRRAAKDRIDPEAEERQRAEEEDEALVRQYFSKAEDMDLMGGEDEQRELKEALAGGGQGDFDEASEGSASTPSRSSVSSPRPVVVKRLVGSGEEVEPEATSLLSERARGLLSSTASTSTSMSNGNSRGATGSASVPPPAKKKHKKNAPNAFGIVRKKT
ncbi:unnamed protein product [Jaminaea pallidilutea]